MAHNNIDALNLNDFSPFAREFELFLECADAGSFLRAAETKGIQQAGLSKLIQKLEDRIEQKLFIRKSRGIELTAFGRQFQSALMKTKQFWAGVYAEELGDRFGLRGRLRIGFHNSVAVSVLPSFIEQVLERFPLLRVETDFDTSLEITRKVADLNVDLGIVVNPVKSPDLKIKKLKSEYISAWHSGAKHEKVLVYNPNMFNSARLIKKFVGYRQLPITDYEVIGSVLKNTNYLGLLPNPIAERYDLTSASEKLLNVDLSLIWHRARFASGAQSEVIRLILASATE